MLPYETRRDFSFLLYNPAAEMQLNYSVYSELNFTQKVAHRNVCEKFERLSLLPARAPSASPAQTHWKRQP